MSEPIANPFHAHLDTCPRCSNQPFNLCEEGSRLANIAFASITAKLSQHLGAPTGAQEK